MKIETVLKFKRKKNELTLRQMKMESICLETESDKTSNFLIHSQANTFFTIKKLNVFTNFDKILILFNEFNKN